MSDKEQLERSIYTYYNYLIRSLRSSLPIERKSIKEILESRNYNIKLQDGGYHTIDQDELDKASSLIPRYMWSRIKLPLIVGKVSGSIYFKLINCIEDEFKFILALAGKGNDSTYRDPCILYIDELEEIIRKYRTLIIQTIEL